MHMEHSSMSNRVVKQDKNGLYITNDRRRFRPSGRTQAWKGQKVMTFAGDMTAVKPRIEVRCYERQTTATKGWNGKPSTITKNVPVWVEADWTTTDPRPQIAENLAKGQANLVVRTPAGNATVVVAADELKFRNYKPKGSTGWTYGCTDTTDKNVLITGGILMNWEEWDKLVEHVNQSRHVVQIGPIAAKLEADIKAEDELQEFLVKAGLVPGQDTRTELERQQDEMEEGIAGELHRG
jgi:hypothetical protein